jgi:hypothetical protein
MNITLSQYASNLYKAYDFQSSNTTTVTSDSLTTLESDVSNMSDVLELTSGVSISGITNVSDYVNYRYLQAQADLSTDSSDDSSLSLLTGDTDTSALYTTGIVSETAQQSIDEAAYETASTTSAYSAYKSSISDQIGTLLDITV